MILARVVGEVVSTHKRPQFEGAKLLILQPETPGGREGGASLLAIDSVGAGRGELVIAVLEGRAAQEALGKKLAPVDCRDRRHRRPGGSCTNDGRRTARAGAGRDRTASRRQRAGARLPRAPCAGAARGARIRASASFWCQRGDEEGGPCLIEPSVRCNHCGFCQSYGH